ncbi:MAG: hypothetical protein KJI72_03490 [Patescibacteria group bacterium]|nr:hypothetical protein [Patescibacteria group bacterium]
MKRRIRNTLFAIFVSLFFVVGGYLTLTAQGWVVDINNLSIVKTGALFLKFSPDDAIPTINDKIPQHISSGLIQSGILIKNLTPGNYVVKLSKSGYEDWVKNLSVKSGLVTAASQIKLWPNNISVEPIITEQIKNFWPTNKGVIYQKDDNKIIFDKLVLRGKSVVLANQESKLIITTEDKNYFLINLDTPLTAINLSHLFNSLKQRQLSLPGTVPIAKIFVHPFSPNKLLITSSTSLYSLDLKKIQLEKLVTMERIKTVNLSNNEAFLTDQDNNLIIVSLLLKTTSQYPLKIISLSDVSINPNGTKVFILTADGGLVLYNRSSQTFTPIAENIKEFYLSPKEKRVALITNDNKLNIFYLSNYQSDLRYQASTVTEIPLPVDGQERQEIKEFSWIPKTLNYSLIFLDENLMVNELDTRAPTNHHTLFTEVKKYFLVRKDLYVLRKNGDLLKVNLDDLN